MVVEQIIRQVLWCNNFVIICHCYRPNYIENMGNKCWREGNIPIYGSNSFFLEDLHIQQRSRGIVGGEVGVAQSKISELHPTSILLCTLPIPFTAHPFLSD